MISIDWQKNMKKYYRTNNRSRNRMDHLVLPLAFLASIHILIIWIGSIRRGLRKRKMQSGNHHSSSGHLPFVSVLIPAWNERMIVERLVKNLQKIHYPSWEVILI